MARVSRPRMAILVGSQEIEASFNPEDENIITTALKEHATAKVRLQGYAQFSPGGQIQRIIRVDHVTLLPTGEVPFDPAAKPIWEVIDEIMKDVPEEELRGLPADGAENLDHYLYGAPKRRQ